MMTVLSKLTQGFAALAVVATLGLASSAQAAVTVGEKAPDFTLTNAAGESISLSSFAGKNVVLEWFNKDCPFVRKHYDSANMQTLQKEYVAKDVVWLVINSSAPGRQGHETAAEALTTLEKEAAAPTHYLFDTDGTVGKLYDAKTTPHMFVIDKEGTLVYAGAIDDRASADKADIAGAKNYVRAALDAILAGQAVETASSKPYGCGVKYAN